MDNGRVLLGLLAGVAAGATLGILFAPDSGTNTRKKIMKKGEDYAGSLKGQYNHLLSALNDEVDEFKDEINKVASDGKSRFEDGKSKVQGLKNELSNAVS